MVIVVSQPRLMAMVRARNSPCGGGSRPGRRCPTIETSELEFETAEVHPALEIPRCSPRSFGTASRGWRTRAPAGPRTGSGSPRSAIPGSGSATGAAAPLQPGGPSACRRTGSGWCRLAALDQQPRRGGPFLDQVPGVAVGHARRAAATDSFPVLRMSDSRSSVISSPASRHCAGTARRGDLDLDHPVHPMKSCSCFRSAGPAARFTTGGEIPETLIIFQESFLRAYMLRQMLPEIRHRRRI